MKPIRTPVMTSRTLDGLASASLFFKCENFQRAGAFKFRGASHAVSSLSEEEARHGVATHSSGNHGAALALAARLRGIPAFIVMPSTTLGPKKAAVEAYGGKITLCEPTLEARETTLAQVVAETHATFIHPYDDPRVVAGQGTASRELFDECPNLDAIVVPVGGGGLLAGTAQTTKIVSPTTRVFAAEPAAADDAYRSWKAGRIIPSNNPKTIADGLRTSLGNLGFAAIQNLISGVVTVSEEEIVTAMRLVWERMKIIIEPSSAVPVAAVLKREVPGKRIGIILTGGNVDLDALPFNLSK